MAKWRLSGTDVGHLVSLYEGVGQIPIGKLGFLSKLPMEVGKIAPTCAYKCQGFRRKRAILRRRTGLLSLFCELARRMLLSSSQAIDAPQIKVIQGARISKIGVSHAYYHQESASGFVPFFFRNDRLRRRLCLSGTVRPKSCLFGLIACQKRGPDRSMAGRAAYRSSVMRSSRTSARFPSGMAFSPRSAPRKSRQMCRPSTSISVEAYCSPKKR